MPTPPPPRSYNKHICRAWKTTKPRQFHKLTKKAAAAFRAYGISQGWEMRQQQSAGNPNIIEVWRMK